MFFRRPIEGEKRLDKHKWNMFWEMEQKGFLHSPVGFQDNCLQETDSPLCRTKLKVENATYVIAICIKYKNKDKKNYQKVLQNQQTKIFISGFKI